MYQPNAEKQNLGLGEITMKNAMYKLSARIENLKAVLLQENGQDLIEYALVVSLIAFAAVAGMGTLAGDINTAFENIGTKLTASV